MIQVSSFATWHNKKLGPRRNEQQKGISQVDLDFLDGGAEIGGVLDGLEVIDHAPDDLEPVGDALERLDQLPPRGLDALLELLELALLR